MNENQNQNYTNLGGVLLAWYWCLIVGGVLSLISMAIPALISIAASFIIGVVYAIGALVTIVTVCVSAVFNIKAAQQLKARNPQFFDTFVMGMFISIGGGIVANLLQIRGAYSISSFVTGTISSIIGVTISLCICVMYFSKSVRAKTYFGGYPLHNSQYWNWIKLLPDFIISDVMPDPSKMQQMGSSVQQPTTPPQEVQSIEPASEEQPNTQSQEAQATESAPEESVDSNSKE